MKVYSQVIDRSRYFVLICIVLLLGILCGRQLASRILSNLSALVLPNIQNVGTLAVHDDKHRAIRAQALALDPHNRSAQIQEFRWLRATGHLEYATSWIPIADRFQFFSNYPDTAWFFAEYAWDKAQKLAKTGQLAESIQYYYLALSLSSQLPDPERLTSFYDTLARFKLLDEDLIDQERHHIAGKLFVLAGRSERAFEQALHIDSLAQSNVRDAESVSWASWMSGEADLQAGRVREAITLFQVSIENGKNPRAAMHLLDLAQEENRTGAAGVALDYLSQLTPDWNLDIPAEECARDTWILAGLDVDRDILSISPDVLVDLYWLPQCNRFAWEFGLIDTGHYWIQPHYLITNVFINAGYEWELPDEERTVRLHPPDCCNIVLDEHNRVLSIVRSGHGGTSAVRQTVPRQVLEEQMYLVGGRIRWGDSVGTESASAIIGGFWLDETDTVMDGPYSIGRSNFLQSFIRLKLSNIDGVSNFDWVEVAHIIHSPSGAAKLSPWVGLSTGHISEDGAVEVFFDDLFLVPIHPPQEQ
jgi:tetratricopeptide (TPR) repeat protein